MHLCNALMSVRLFRFHWLVVFFLAALPVCSATRGPAKTSETPHRRTTFWAGGRYVFNSTLNGTILVDQIYVERLVPVYGATKRYPLLFVHGGGISGTQWLNKPDGNRGWASYFLEKGYEVLIIDVWSVGRSSARDLPTLRGGSIVENVELAFTAPEIYKKYYQAQFHTQWPGTGLRGDPTFDAFYSEFLPLSFSTTQQNNTRNAVCALLKLTGPALFITHSAGTSTGLLAADACPDLVKGHATYEGDQTPFAGYNGGVLGALTPIPVRAYGIADIPLTYAPPVTDPSQLVKVETGKLKLRDGLLAKYPCFEQANTQASRPRKLINIAKSPILYLTSQASIHITYNHCSVNFLRQAGVKVKWTKLTDIGLYGNGHFGMLERNSDAIANYIHGWLETFER